MKDIKGYEGLYAVTSCGRVWSYRSKRFLSPANKNGYKRVMLQNNGAKKSFLVHRLVAEAYIPNPDNLPEINHIDEIRDHNWIKNLEWCDRKYNCNYGTKNDSYSKAVRCIETGIVYKSVCEAARQLNLDRANISHVCHGDFKTSGGYHWEFV